MAVSLRDLVRVPGLLSLARLPLAIAFACTLAWSWWVPSLILVAAAASDMLDGWYARRFDQTSETGALLDPIMDKLFVVTVVVALVIGARLSIVEAALLGARELGVLLIVGVLALQSRPRTVHRHPPHILGKLTTVLQYAAALAAVTRTSAIAIFALAAAISGALATATYWRHEREVPRRR